ncbi:MAG: hypothetical protein IK066_01110 [Kiritimatiellae bacterium]|nr:hypothetical protein [Kiritimatiellia bacterium]
MKLNTDGRKRLDAMKKALAAGLPLAGLLAAAACSKEAQKAEAQRNWVYRGEAEEPVALDPPAWQTDDQPMGDLLVDNPVEAPEQIPIEVRIATDMDRVEVHPLTSQIVTHGIMAPPIVSPSAANGEKRDSDDDVVVSVEDAPPAEEGQP